MCFFHCPHRVGFFLCPPLRLVFRFPFYAVLHPRHSVLICHCASVSRCKSHCRRIIGARPVQDHVTEGLMDISPSTSERSLCTEGFPNFRRVTACIVSPRSESLPFQINYPVPPTCANFSTICIIPLCITFSSVTTLRSRSPESVSLLDSLTRQLDLMSLACVRWRPYITPFLFSLRTVSWLGLVNASARRAVVAYKSIWD